MMSKPILRLDRKLAGWSAASLEYPSYQSSLEQLKRIFWDHAQKVGEVALISRIIGTTDVMHYHGPDVSQTRVSQVNLLLQLE